jgi:hypothetical protein
MRKPPIALPHSSGVRPGRRRRQAPRRRLNRPAVISVPLRSSVRSGQDPPAEVPARRRCWRAPPRSCRPAVDEERRPPRVRRRPGRRRVRPSPRSRRSGEPRQLFPGERPRGRVHAPKRLHDGAHQRRGGQLRARRREMRGRRGELRGRRVGHVEPEPDDHPGGRQTLPARFAEDPGLPVVEQRSSATLRVSGARLQLIQQLRHGEARAQAQHLPGSRRTGQQCRSRRAAATRRAPRPVVYPARPRRPCPRRAALRERVKRVHRRCGLGQPDDCRERCHHRISSSKATPSAMRYQAKAAKLWCET